MSNATSSGTGKSLARYNFAPGKVLARKYEVVSPLGAVHGGELYALNERDTGIGRTGRFFYPHSNPGNRVATQAAKALHRLRHCGILMEYRTQEIIRIDGEAVTFLVSDLMRGETLKSLLARQPSERLSWFEGLHLLRALTAGVEALHAAGEAHGALAAENLIVHRRGLGYEVKVIDFAPHRSKSTNAAIRADVDALVRVFLEAIGGIRGIARQPPDVKTGVKQLVARRMTDPFRTTNELSRHLDDMRWG